MRCIKFRGVDVFSGKIVYGDLVHNKKVTKDGLEDRVMVGGYEVSEDSVGQYTGCDDKNSEPIYEKDKVSSIIHGKKIVGRVVYGYTIFGYGFSIRCVIDGFFQYFMLNNEWEIEK